MITAGLVHRDARVPVFKPAVYHGVRTAASNATVIFDQAGRKAPRGTALTVRCAKAAARPYVVLHGFPAVAAGAAALTDFLSEQQPGILNVAGNRDSKTPGCARTSSAS